MDIDKKIDRKVKFLLWIVPAMLIMLMFVVYESSKVRNSQVENSGVARQQRELSIKLTQMALKKMDTIIHNQDTVFLLFKAKTKK